MAESLVILILAVIILCALFICCALGILYKLVTALVAFIRHEILMQPQNLYFRM